MSLQINANNFEEIMKRIEREIEDEGVSAQGRPFRAIMKLAKETGYEGLPLSDTTKQTHILRAKQGMWEGLNLFQKVNEWYQLRWGEKLKTNGLIGEVPVLIHGEVYFIKIPYIFGAGKIDLFNSIEDMTQGLWLSLIKPERDLLVEIFNLAINFFYAMDEVKEGKLCANAQGGQLIFMGLKDLRTAINGLKNQNPEYQNCCFHTQQAVEKYLKGFLLCKTEFTEEELKRKIGHKLNKLFDKACEYCDAFTYFKDDIESVNFDMGIRYELRDNIGKQETINAIHVSLLIGTLIVNVLFDVEQHVKSIIIKN